MAMERFKEKLETLSNLLEAKKQLSITTFRQDDINGIIAQLMGSLEADYALIPPSYGGLHAREVKLLVKINAQLHHLGYRYGGVDNILLRELSLPAISENSRTRKQETLRTLVSTRNSLTDFGGDVRDVDHRICETIVSMNPEMLSHLLVYSNAEMYTLQRSDGDKMQIDPKPTRRMISSPSHSVSSFPIQSYTVENIGIFDDSPSLALVFNHGGYDIFRGGLNLAVARPQLQINFYILNEIRNEAPCELTFFHHRPFGGAVLQVEVNSEERRVALEQEIRECWARAFFHDL
ncbi:MAG: hypothetical protein LQ351_001965 [Letrouitia transgressa]|nr:MAG: hypothetical protein LQ351_001965 [Letrouitia transgressa]